MMTLHEQTPLLPKLWQRIKHLLRARALKPKKRSQCDRHKAFLEECLRKDCPVEANRKRLERCWEDISSRDNHWR